MYRERRKRERGNYRRGISGAGGRNEERAWARAERDGGRAWCGGDWKAEGGR